MAFPRNGSLVSATFHRGPEPNRAEVNDISSIQDRIGNIHPTIREFDKIRQHPLAIAILQNFQEYDQYLLSNHS